MAALPSLGARLGRYHAQEILFAPRLSRLDLLGLGLPPGVRRQFRINVWRNHSFEPLIPVVQPFAAYGGWDAEFRLGGYDDTLMFAGMEAADAELLWLDSSRFSASGNRSDAQEWLGGRLRTLRALTTAPIILAAWGEGSLDQETLQTLADSLPAVYFADVAAVCAEAGVAVLDLRSALFAGTPLSNPAQLVLARELACHWLPATLFPPIKAVALDLDDTLHTGVLGEDGLRGVQLDQGHADFQRYIKSLHKRGIMIALVSRNERPDVEALFAQRSDYPLRWEDFSAIEVSWGDKATAVERVAKALRIGSDAVLFVDDNPGELANIAMRMPQVPTIFAHPDASQTQRAVHYYPGLWRWKVGSDDAKRIDDLKATAVREALAEHIADPAEYFRSLQITLAYRNDPPDQLGRLAELCNKTNQFNLSLRRFNQVELAERMNREDACVTSIQLTDRLSDSGIIAVIVAERHGRQLVVEELCLSCRAIGRQLESTIILTALRGMPIFPGCEEVAFHVREGLRNQPAREWLSALLDRTDMPPGEVRYVPAERVIDYLPAEGVVLINR